MGMKRRAFQRVYFLLYYLWSTKLVQHYQINQCQKALPGPGMRLVVLTQSGPNSPAQLRSQHDQATSPEGRFACSHYILGSKSINSVHLGSSVPFGLNA